MIWTKVAMNSCLQSKNLYTETYIQVQSSSLLDFITSLNNLPQITPSTVQCQFTAIIVKRSIVHHHQLFFLEVLGWFCGFPFINVLANNDCDDDADDDVGGWMPLSGMFMPRPGACCCILNWFCCIMIRFCSCCNCCCCWSSLWSNCKYITHG